MKFIDESIILVSAGNGGNGCISFKKKNKHLIPNGGNGGNGGNFFIIADRNINNLGFFKLKKKFKAENGKNGKSENCTGKSGKDSFIKVPLGTKIIDYYTNELIVDMTKNNQILMIAKGGANGIGNNKLKSYINRNAFIKSNGIKGEIRKIKLKLILLVDVGIIGLPNSGKSTFVRSISSSKTKIANYPFTTLVPHLGVVKTKNNKSFVIADIPGIIKGAASKNSLSIRFLKHLERCKILLHFVEIIPKNKLDILININIIISEIKKFNKNLYYKPCWLIFNKSDLFESKDFFENIVNKLNWKQKYYIISSINNKGLKNLCLDIASYIYKKKI